MKKKTLAMVGIASMFAFISVCSADDVDNDFLHSDNCVGSRWTDAGNNPISIDDKFGPGSQAVTRCLGETRRAKVLYQINTLHKDSTATAPYAIGNIMNHIVDFETTHGMSGKNYEIVVVVHSAGWKMVLNDNPDPVIGASNPYLAEMTNLVSNPNVTVLFCQNTASKKKIKLADMIEGIGFTTAGVSAISDLQEEGYRYIQP